MRKSVFILFIIGLFCVKLRAQKLEYDVVKGENVIGNMTAVKEVLGDSLHYTISSKTAFKMIFTLNVVYDLSEDYYQGILQDAYTLSTLNGAVQREAELRKFANYYEVESSSDRVKIYKKEIKYSVSEVYFSEPKDGAEVFSAGFAEYLTFEKIGEHTYLLDSPDGKNKYYYNEQGICKEVKVSRPYVSFSMILK